MSALPAFVIKEKSGKKNCLTLTANTLITDLQLQQSENLTPNLKLSKERCHVILQLLTTVCT